MAAVAVRPSTATITPPAGWTLVRREDNASGNTNSLALYQRVASDAEPADYTWTFSSSTGHAAGISLELNYELQPAAGASGARTATASNHSDTGNAILIALSPGP